MNSIVNLKDGFITFNSNIDHSLSFSKCAIGYSNYSINSHERGALVFLTNNNANTANVSMHSDIRMCIASDGNIGIGTNNPSQKLDIAGNTNISRILKIGGINQNDDEIKLQVYASSNNIIAIFKHPNDSQGIGISYDSVFALGSDTNATQPISIKSKGNTNVVLNTNSIDRLTVFGNGNVGIGTNNANSRLHLHNTTANSDVGIRFSDFTSGAGATQGFAIGENSTQQAYLLNYGNTDMLFSTNNAERLRILANGNVGIGTATPETILDINGNLLIRAYAGTSGTNGIFFRPGFATTNQYNCSILTFDHSSGGANDGISINGFQGVSFCTGANTRQERMRIDGGGNVGIGTTNPAYRTHIKCVYDDISKGLHLDASDDVPSAPNQYALTIYPYIVGAGQVGWKFRSQSQIGGTQTPLTFNHAGNVILGGTISGNGSLLTSINAANISSGTIDSLRLPTATTSVLGGVKVDGTTITINSSTGVISGANTYVLPTASTSVLGGVKVDGTIHTIINDTLKIIEPTSYLMQDVETNVRMYPPIRNFTGASGTTIAVSGQQYGNGNYTIHYTSQQVDYYRPTTVFNEIEERGGIWGANNYTNGVYNKTLSIVNDTSYPGDGVKIQFPVSIRLTSYILKNSYDIATAPKDFRIYGSINGTTWDILDQRANITHMDVSATFGKFAHIYEQDVNTYNYYSHYAITVNKNNGRDFIHIDEWYIYGREAIPSQYNYKKNSIIKYVAGNQNDINFRNTGSWQISDDILPATNNVLGGVKGGGNISIATDGTISAIGYKIKNINADNISTGTINSLRLPVATASDIGGVKKGNNINIVDGTISVDLLSYNGNSTINGDLVVNSNLIIHGTSTTLNTDVYTTERLEITNSGTINPTLTIKQTAAGNTNNIFNVINSATTNVFNVSSTGNVGIGITNPASLLNIKGTNPILSIFGQGNIGAKSQINLSTYDPGVNASSCSIIATDDGNFGSTFQINLKTSGAVTNSQFTPIFINNSGNVGIGTTSNTSGVLLDVNGTIESRNSIGANTSFYLKGVANSDINRVITAGQYSTNSAINDMVIRSTNKLVLQSGTTSPGIVIDTGNNVGIGITNPVAQNSLQIHKTGTSQFIKIALTDGTTTGGANRGLHIIKETDQTGFIYNYENKDLAFGTNATEKMRILANGNIGIGTNADIQSKLTINGINTNVANSFDHSEAPLTITNPTATSTSVLNDPKAVLNLCRTGTTGQAYSTRACFKLCRYENDSVNSRTRLDITLAHNYYDELNIISLQSGGNVGIGRTNPTEQLHVNGNFKAGGSVYCGAVIAGDHIFTTADNARLGIGINPYTPTSSHIHLHRTTTNTEIKLQLTDGTTLSTATDGLALYKGTDQHGYLWNYENKDLAFGTNATEQLRILANGNVGIGTNSAQHSLHLHKTATAQDVRLLFTDGTTTSVVNRGFQIGKNASSESFIWNYENSAIQFATSGSERMRILANGNIGIGTNADIQSKLTINGINTEVANSFDHSEAPLTITNPTATSSSVLNDPKGVLNLCRTGTANQAFSARACFKLCRYENSFPNSRTRLDITLAHNQYDELNIMSLQSGGNVGIGTTNPVSRLHLHNTTANSDVAIRFTDSTSGAGATNGFVIGENSTQKAYLWNYGNTDMLFATNNAERMTISNAGNVGIGTISPNANLHLHGNAASQNVRISFSDNTSGIATTDGFCIGKDSLQKAYIYNCENADIDFGTSNTERMRIMANGNIGIGTNSSLSSLHLHKNALAQDVRMIISDNTSTSSLIRGLHLIKGTDNIGYLWNYENTPLILATNNAERMRIAENGNVGIGTTPAIHFFHLHMNNTTDVLRLCFTNNNTTTAANRGFVMGIHSNRDTFLWNNENTSLVFGTNNIGRIIILANGNVGIGTETGIGEKLVVSGNAQITGTISGNGSLLTSINAANISSGTIDSLRLPIAGSGAGGILGGVKVDGTTITINASGIITSVGGGGSSQWTTSGINIYNANTGNIGIGTNNPAIYKCQVNGNLGATGNITAYYSDERLKNITEYVSDVLPALDKINVFKYNCNDLAESFGYDKSKKEIGLSAQEIQKFYPEIVSIAPFDADCDKETNKIISKSGENYLTLDYERLVPILLQAIKELNRKYTALEDKYNKIMPT